ncbi:hypothetical protein BFP75_00830 [Maribacter sp. 4G9]|nr:hypothetical protein BFP75_00830 [Maribacter sp. 4G9]
MLPENEAKDGLKIDDDFANGQDNGKHNGDNFNSGHLVWLNRLKRIVNLIVRHWESGVKI